jgi:type VI protein secretion system component VasK
MNRRSGMFADLEIEDVINNWNRMDTTTRDAILVFGALTVVTLIIVVWAAFIRKKPREHSSQHHHRHRPATQSEAVSQETAEEPGRERRRRRRRRREHRPRNPTLAETGGLPPVKPEGSGDLVP